MRSYVQHYRPLRIVSQPALVERALAIVLLGLAALPAGLTALLVWLAVGRPILFHQVRSGKYGCPFTITKFRTMHDFRDTHGQLLPDTLRQTRLTRFIRRKRLDEIPQLFAIAAGDMRFIGPRPLEPAAIASLGRLGASRGRVCPGLTGWAQVNGNSRLTNLDKIALDLWYIDHCHPVLNARILARTVSMVIRGERLCPQAIEQARRHLDEYGEIAS